MRKLDEYLKTPDRVYLSRKEAFWLYQAQCEQLTLLFITLNWLLGHPPQGPYMLESEIKRRIQEQGSQHFIVNTELF